MYSLTVSRRASSATSMATRAVSAGRRGSGRRQLDPSRLLRAECDHRIDASGAASRNVTRQRRDPDEQRGGGYEARRIVDIHLIQHCAEYTDRDDRAREAANDAEQRERDAVADDEPHDLRGISAECDA